MLGFLGGKIGASLIGSGLIALLLGGGFLWLRSHYIGVGEQRAYAAVAAKDAKAIAKAEKARGTVQQCFDRGGAWNVEDGSCEEKKP